jgi:ABC-type multidrug transport system ATPase subunit
VALANVAFSLARGRVLGLVGTNGSGRTTLIKILATQLKPSSGEVEIDGINSLKHPFHVRPKIGYVPQAQTFYDYMTVGEYMRFVILSRREKPGNGVRAHGPEELFGDLAADLPLRTLSPGSRQKLALNAALIHRPALLLLDEPLNSLDPLATTRFHRMITDFKVQGGTVVMASNRTWDVAALCDEVLLLHQGRLLASVNVSGPDMDLGAVFERLVRQKQESGNEAPSAPADSE